MVRVDPCDTPWRRLRGLLGRPAPAPGHGVWIVPCRQVHTFGMGYPIDVVHLDRRNVVLAVQELRPWRVGRWVAGARGVLELRAGEARRLGLGPGCTVFLIPVQNQRTPRRQPSGDVGPRDTEPGH